MKKINFLAIFLAQMIGAQSINLIKDIYPGVQGSSPQYLAKYIDKVYFSASNPISGSELWVTDGTTEGTQMVGDQIPGTNGQVPARLTVFNNKIYYSSLLGDTASPSGLYTYDVTNGVKLLSENHKWSSGLMTANNKFYFNANNFLYEVDANDNIKKVSEDVNPNGYAAALNGKLLFGGRPVSSTNYYYQLYSYDGTTTTLLKTINPTNTGGVQNLFYSSALGKVFFSVSYSTTSSEPWVTDGTEAGTFRLKDISSASIYSGSSPSDFTQMGDKVIFVASDFATTGTELYITDGTEAGTKLLKDINPGSSSSSPSKLISLNGKIYFFANGGSNDAQLWATDVTADGTKLTLKLNPGSTTFYLADMVGKDNALYLSAKLGVSPGQELYKVNLAQGDLSVTPLSSKKSSVYPNPTTGELFVESNAKGNFEVYDFTGKLIQKGKIGTDSKINLIAEPGIYQLKTISENAKEKNAYKIIVK